MSNFNYSLNQLTDSKTYTHIQLPIKNDSGEGKIGLIQDIDFGVMEGFGYSAGEYGDSSQIKNFVSFVTTVDLLFKNLNTRITDLKSIVDSLNNTYTVILIVNYGNNSSRYEQTVNLGNSASWEMSPPNGYSWPTSVNNGTINGNTITSNVVTESNTVNRKMTVTVTCKASTIAVTNITLNKSSLSINANNTDTITATVSPSDATSKTINWSSDDPTVATVTTTTTSGQTATVTWKKAGTCTITATAASNTGVSATCEVTCKASTIAVTNITLNKSSLSINANNTDTITATVSPSDATSKTINWSSDDPTVATVTTTTTSGQTATVTWKKAGTCTITATAASNTGVSATCEVTCKDATNNCYIGVAQELTFTESDLNQYVATKPETIELPVGTRYEVSVWIYPESWGKPIKANPIIDGSVMTEKNDIDNFIYSGFDSLPAGYIGCYIALDSATTYKLTW